MKWGEKSVKGVAIRIDGSWIGKEKIPHLSAVLVRSLNRKFKVGALSSL